MQFIQRVQQPAAKQPANDPCQQRNQEDPCQIDEANPAKDILHYDEILGHAHSANHIFSSAIENRARNIEHLFSLSGTQPDILSCFAH